MHMIMYIYNIYTSMQEASLTVSPQCEVGKGEVMRVSTEQCDPIEVARQIDDG